MQSIESSEVTGTQQPSRIRRWLPLILTGLGALVVGAILTFALLRPSSSEMAIWASIDMPRGAEYVSGVGGHSAISPDGTMIVFSAIDSLFQRMLWIRPLKSLEARALPGTKDAEYPFWSFDSRSIGFFAEGKLRSVNTAGGPVVTIADAPLGRGAAWGKTGVIVYSPEVSNPNLFAVASSGGQSRSVTAFDTVSGIAPRFPFFLPDGKHFVFTSVGLGGGVSTANTITYVGTIDGGPALEIGRGLSNCVYASGYLLYLSQGILMAQAFDVDALNFTGDPLSLQEGVNAWAPRAKGDFSSSENGILLSSIGSSFSQEEFVWIDADGRQEPFLKADLWSGARLSPDGTRIVYDEANGQNQSIDLWIYDIQRKVKTRFTFGSNSSYRPLWSKDGLTVYYGAEIGPSKANLMTKRADGTGDESLLARGSDPNMNVIPMDIAPDGRTLLVASTIGVRGDLGTVDLSVQQRPVPIVDLGIRGENARFSPDGRWIVYQSDESGKRELYVRSSRGGEGKWQISSGSGEEAIWTNSGIVFYSSSVDAFLKVTATPAAGGLAFSQATPLFSSNTTRLRNIFSQTRDGRRFLGSRAISAQNNRSLSVVANWPQLLKR